VKKATIKDKNAADEVRNVVTGGVSLRKEKNRHLNKIKYAIRKKKRLRMSDESIGRYEYSGK
jgi:predicted DNA-binding transcriptional regulator YafY